MGKHGKGQKAVGNGAAKRCLPGQLFVHMDVLAVFRALGKFVDPLLADFKPVAGFQPGSGVAEKFFLRNNSKAHLHSPVMPPAGCWPRVLAKYWRRSSARKKAFEHTVCISHFQVF